MANFKLKDAVIKRLSQQPGESLKAREIAEWIIATYPEAAKEKLAKSTFIETETQLRNQFVAEIGSNRPAWEAKHPELRTTAGKPRRYYWSKQTDEDAVVADAISVASVDVDSTKAVTFSESDLYPRLRQFVLAEFGVVALRIDEKTASNTKGLNANKWLFPDVCGMQNLISGYQGEIVNLIRLSGGRKSLLWSFEVKTILNGANVRESYFQTVSNSSWANYGYLVAAQVDDKVMDELRVLHNLHGIGLVRLDVEEPTESEILIPARMRESPDWGVMNRLATENADYRKYVKLVRQFYQTDEASLKEWSE